MGHSAVHTDQRIPTLDGWRGIAVFMVLLSHVQAGYLRQPIGGSRWFNTGEHGVQIFFVLIGYLITANLLRENRIDLVSFYIRRFFRLMPAAWTYLIFLGLLSAFTNIKAIGSDVWSCLFFFRNYLPETSANTCTSHFWSLSQEEQFYLAWPPILALLGRRRAAFIAAGIAVAFGIYKDFAWALPRLFHIFQPAAMRSDGLLIGCLLALVLQRESIRAWLKRYGCLVFWICLVPLGSELYKFQIDGIVTLQESILISVLIACTSLNPSALPGRILDWHFLKTTGLMSYSIYLRQGLFIRANWGMFGPILFAAAFLLSWRFIEEPGRHFGKRLLARRIPTEAPAESVIVSS